jgi:hypothetical protein
MHRLREEVHIACHDTILKNYTTDSTEMSRNIEGENDDKIMEERTTIEKRVTKGIKVTKSIQPPCGETSAEKRRNRKK